MCLTFVVICMQKTDSLNLNRFVTTAAEFSPSAATKLKAHNSYRVVTFLHRMKIKFGRQIFESFCRLEIFGLVSLDQRRHFKNIPFDNGKIFTFSLLAVKLSIVSCVFFITFLHGAV